jgi:hypothetical protein
VLGNATPSDLRLFKDLLTRPVRSTRAGRARYGASALGAVVLLGVLCNTPARASTPATEIFKLYAHTKLTNHKQYVCLNKLWTKESNWNPLAKNKRSSAFGIPQLLKLKEKDPFKQIDLGLKYIESRYTNPCNAWYFFVKKGYY